jgi:hypothetical protein
VALDRSRYNIEPMDLANMRQNGVRSLDVSRAQRRALPDHLPGAPVAE